MTVLELPNDNAAWYAALEEWIKRDPETRASKKLGDLTSGEFSEILLMAQDHKVRARAARETH